MVKPSKTMQPESVNLAKAGRASGKAFEDDSFHNYMARKIDMQRKQFGVVLPPDPRTRQHPSDTPTKKKGGTVRFANDVKDSPPRKKAKKKKRKGGMNSVLRRLQRRHGRRKVSDLRRKEKINEDNPKEKEILKQHDDEEDAMKEKDGSNTAQNGDIESDADGLISPTRLRRNRPDLFFLGVVIMVNGYTNPDDVSLQRLLHKHGGDMEKYQTSRVTHIIAEHLSTAKANMYKGQRKPLPVCYPAWILDCVEAGRLLPHGDYIIEEVRDQNTSKETVKTFFSAKRTVSKGEASIMKKVRGSSVSTKPVANSLGQPNNLKEGNEVKERIEQDSENEESIAGNTPHQSRLEISDFSPHQESNALPTDQSINLTERSDNGREVGNFDFHMANSNTASISEDSSDHGKEKSFSHRTISDLDKGVMVADGTIDETVFESVRCQNVNENLEVQVDSGKDEKADISTQNFIIEQDEGYKNCNEEPRVNTRSECDVKIPIEPSETLKSISFAQNGTDGICNMSKSANSDNKLESGGETVSSKIKQTSELSLVNESDADSKELRDRNPSEGNTENEPHIVDSDNLSLKSNGLRPSTFNPESHGENSQVDSQGRTDDKYINGRIRTVGTDPNFLESFFKNSRLCFIGSYKQRVKQQKRCGSAGVGGTRRFVFHVDMDCFFVAVALRNFPQYRQMPVAISHQGKRKSDLSITQNSFSKNSTSECATCNYEARKYGVKKGMFLGRAKELCPNLIVLQYDFEGYEEVSEQVSSILEKYCNLYDGETEQVSCDESYVELFVSPNQHDPYQYAGDIAENIRKEIFEATECTASIGVGPNKFLAKLSTDKAKPNGSFVARDHRKLLEKLDLRELHGIGYRTEHKLTAQGLTKVHDVWDLGEEAETVLCKILGPGLGKKVFSFCHGEDNRQVKPAERKTIGAECNYGVRFNGEYGVDHMIAGLAKEIEKRMAGVGVKGCHVTLKIKRRKEGAKPPPKFLGHGSCHNLSKGIETQESRLTRDWKVLSKLGNSLFADLAVPIDDIRGMGLVVSKLVGDNDSEAKGENDFSPQSIKKWFGNHGNAEVCEKRPKKLRMSTEQTKPTEAISQEEKMSPQTLCNSADDLSTNETLPIPSASLPTASKMHGNAAECAEHRPTFSQIDEEVFASLPEEIRQEIISESSSIKSSKLSALHTTNSFGTDQEAIEVDENENNDTKHQAANKEEGNQERDDFAIPPASQIDMNEVAALPSPIRERVFSKISDARRVSFSPVAAGDSYHSNPVVPEQGNVRYRQVSVKRMLRLASVKAGRESVARAGESVALSQLNCLPLELQLQVANNDNDVVGVLSPRKTSKGGRQHSAAQVSGTENPVTSSSDSTCTAAKSDPTHKKTQIKTQASKATICREDETVCHKSIDSICFYQENVVPLQSFMDENPDANGTELDRVKEFFDVCVTGHSLRDVVVLLRTIKNRRDRWSGGAYQQILVAVDEKCRKVFRRKLDRAWLNL